MNKYSAKSVYFGFQLERLCGDILVANNWLLDRLSTEFDQGVDILAKDPKSHETVAFEIKYTRNSFFPLSSLKVSATRLVKAAQEIGVSRAVLIVAANVKPEVQQLIESEHGIQVINIEGLLSLASADLDLLGHLVKLCEIDLTDKELNKKLSQIIHPEVLKPASKSQLVSENERLGRELISKLRDIPLGRDGCYAFEDTASEILKYLFDGDLTGWHQQESTADELHRYDLICRVLEKSVVWKFISTNLDSRYVLFEFKNYKEKIGQGQVYSTEKYLFEKAKRRVCFLISRKGPADNAVTACQGAMREHGKLIINLDENDLIVLIESKIKGDDPNDIIFNRIDEFLMTLPR